MKGVLSFFTLIYLQKMMSHTNTLTKIYICTERNEKQEVSLKTDEYREDKIKRKLCISQKEELKIEIKFQ